jgi:hypothetical protein
MRGLLHIESYVQYNKERVYLASLFGIKETGQRRLWHAGARSKLLYLDSFSLKGTFQRAGMHFKHPFRPLYLLLPSSFARSSSLTADRE